MHRARQARGDSAFALESQASLTAHDQEVKFRTAMRGPKEALLRVGSEARHDLVDHKSLPRCPDFRMTFQVIARRQVQQGMQHTTITNVDLWGLDLALPDIAKPRWKLPYHQGGRQGVEVVSDSRSGYAKGPGELSPVPDLRMVMGQHGPKTA